MPKGGNRCLFNQITDLSHQAFSAAFWRIRADIAATCASIRFFWTITASSLASAAARASATKEVARCRCASSAATCFRAAAWIAPLNPDLAAAAAPEPQNDEGDDGEDEGDDDGVGLVDGDGVGPLGDAEGGDEGPLGDAAGGGGRPHPAGAEVSPSAVPVAS